ncbi:hypothetical protein OSB04_005270 [Centaurea solstitialis]|uniref:Receptor-like serine/threonine-protein kinase n=1 Tax=Centaurea solstitialis TaxID=347529 RepID=A0AA38TSB8_9ASTR|nr:hypothetical protein OSB04_005270 [Centaurea solstitialis]
MQSAIGKAILPIGTIDSYTAVAIGMERNRHGVADSGKLMRRLAILARESTDVDGLGLLTRGSSLSVDNKDNVLVSLNGYFTAGFNQVGDNAYVFAVWLTEQTATKNRDMVWMANRDAPVKKKHSKLLLRDDGNLVLTDADEDVIWSTNTKSTSSSVRLLLNRTGNLMLYDKGEGQPLWQSFDHPTDTLLPNQPFTKNTQLVSSKSSTNYGSGFYKLFFDDDSILRLHYNGPETTIVFWPDPSLTTWDAMRFQYIDTRRASLDSDGKFNSSDGLHFMSADYGPGPQRIMRIDIDGNLRVYSLIEHGNKKKWEVQWQAISHSCKIHGTCGPNSLCTYSLNSGRKCTCLHGYKMANPIDWSYGCEPEFEPCIRDDCGFIFLRHVEFYGHDVRFFNNITLDYCKTECLNDNTCRGFQFGWKEGERNNFCYIKTSLYNGYQMGFDDSMYIKLPKRLVSSFHQRTVSQSSSSWSSNPVITPAVKSFDKTHEKTPLRPFLVFGCIIGFIEIMCISFFWYHSSKNLPKNEASRFRGATTFRRFTYSELKKATSDFSEEIGRGGACIVYKGKLSDNRIAAVKRLQNANRQGEAEFQAEISTIGRVNHMNLIETWGYCAEGKHRLVVYEYMENGSLAENLAINNKLDWATRLDIAIGTAKGLAYLHEECLEWVLHCDVKPHNILLDANYKAKVADFGLSKLLDRSCCIDQLNFSTIRGTRGYMAPEWVLNFPITAKVDVFSYGVVILEMITGRSPAGKHHTSNENGKTALLLIGWVRDKIHESDRRMESWIEEIVDPTVCGKYDRTMMEKMVRIALQCANEDKETRPSMSEVVDMLLHVS